MRRTGHPRQRKIPSRPRPGNWEGEDELNEQIQRELLTFMMGDPKTISRAMKVNYISRCLERIADHATNIAEMVIFMIKGKDIRHTIA